ncbi:MAG: hypothetical protein GX099_00470 [Clostridiaceae bacterium]|jgi:hypothetical protein|nr:hypothetical protein [Clostridiaceae bacterium]
MRKKSLNLFLLIVCSLMLLSACDLDLLRETTEPEETGTTRETSVTEVTTEVISTTEATTVPTETEPPVNGAPDYLDTLPISDFAILYLEMEYDETDIVTGLAVYDVNGDGTDDSIRIDVNEYAGTTTATINGVSAICITDYFTSAFLIDIDRGDDYIDLFVQDNGPSEDPVSHIFRYNGTHVIHIGDIRGSLRSSRQGQIISSEGYSWYTYPVMVYSWVEIVSGSIIYHKLDSTSYNGQTFGFRREIGDNYGTWMEETAIIPAYDAYPYGPAPTNIIVPAGTEFTVLDVSDFAIGTSPNWYSIRLEDGRTGVFYYMKGD